MRRFFFALFLLSLASLPAAGEECAPAGGFGFICGPAAVEDLVRIPGTHWIVGNGMSESKGPDADSKSWEIFYPGTEPVDELDAKSYPSCPGSPDPGSFGAHGIALRDDGSRRSTVLAVNHGREAVEVFNVDAAREKEVLPTS